MTHHKAIDSNNSGTSLLSNVSSPSKSICSKTQRRKCCTLYLLISGATSLVFGLLSIKYPLQEILLSVRLWMTPGLPPYDLWVKPDPEIHFGVYLFTVENSDAFLNGTDSKLKLKEIGPIIYRENLYHSDVIRHKENSTLSYTAVRDPIFLSELNEPGILNKTIIVPNFALLASAAYLSDASFLTKLGFNLMYRNSDDTMFMNITVYQYLWEYKSSLVKSAGKIVPFMVPVENTGIIYNIYQNFIDRYNVRIGSKYGNSEFFKISQINGQTTVPGFNKEHGDCDATIVNATEGALYSQKLTKETVLWYWRKTICRILPLHFEKEIQMGRLAAYKYVLRGDVYDRFQNETNDCYKGDNLQNGLSDVSKCYYDMPLAASNPHFYQHENLGAKVEGLTPNMKSHESYIIVEPTWGIPIDQCARSQSNLIMPSMSGFPDEFKRFSDMVLPLFWAEYYIKELTTNIVVLLVLSVNILPVFQICLTSFLIMLGAGLLFNGFLRLVVSANIRFISKNQKQNQLYHKIGLKLQKSSTPGPESGNMLA